MVCSKFCMPSSWGIFVYRDDRSMDANLQFVGSFNCSIWFMNSEVSHMSVDVEHMVVAICPRIGIFIRLYFHSLRILGGFPWDICESF